MYWLNGLPQALYCLLIWKARSSVNDNVMVLAILDGGDVSRIVYRFYLRQQNFGSL